MGGRLNEELKKLGDEYGKRILPWESSCSFAPGPLVRVGPNELMFSDAETFRKLSAIRSKYIKGPFYELARAVPGEDHLFSMRDEEKRRLLKTKMAPGVRVVSNPLLSSGINDASDNNTPKVFWKRTRRLRAWHRQAYCRVRQPHRAEVSLDTDRIPTHRVCPQIAILCTRRYQRAGLWCCPGLLVPG